MDGPKTLNGLILEHLEIIPEPGTSLMIARHPIEVTRTQNNAVQMTRMKAAIPETPESSTDSLDSDMDGG